MKIIARPRAGGKTTELLKQMAADESLVFVGQTVAQATVFRGHFSRMVGVAPSELVDRFVSISQLLNRVKPHDPGTKFVVDELDSILQYVLGAPVEFAAFTGEVDVRTGPIEEQN